MFTKEPILGNHIGIVINDNDPENRSRVQVFVPYLSMTLYSGWNSVMKDINIGPGWLDKIDVGLQNRMMRGLPWAESALPIFGGNGSVYNNSETNRTDIIRGDNKTGSSAPVTEHKTDGSFVGPRLPAGSDVPEGKKLQATNYGLYNGEGNPDTNSIFQVGSTSWLIPPGVNEEVPGGSVAITGWLEEALAKKYPEYATPAPGQDGVQNKRYMVKPGTIVEINGVRYLKNDTNLKNASTLDKKEGRVDFFFSPLKGQTEHKSGEIRNVDDVQLVGFNKNLLVKAPDASRSDLAKINEEVKQYGVSLEGTEIKGPSNDAIATALQNSPTYMNFVKQNPYFVEALKKQSGETPTNATPEPVKDSGDHIVKLDTTVSAARSSSGNVSNPGGIKSKPKRGTLVWVFFMGGDVMRPVYFAGVAEPNSESRTSDGNVPVALNGSPRMEEEPSDLTGSDDSSATYNSETEAINGIAGGFRVKDLKPKDLDKPLTNVYEDKDGFNLFHFKYTDSTGITYNKLVYETALLDLKDSTRNPYTSEKLITAVDTALKNPLTVGGVKTALSQMQRKDGVLSPFPSAGR